MIWKCREAAHDGETGKRRKTFMYAVIETGGKQYRVQPGDVVRVEKLDGVQAGDAVSFDKVLVLSGDNGLQVGTPYIEGEKVEAEVCGNGKAQKIIVFKYKSKKDYRKKQGHRQPYTEVLIKNVGGVEAETPAADEEQTAEEVKPSMSMKKDELLAYAKDHDVEVAENLTKQEILDAINAAE